jgi:hypothetical protein
MLNRHSGVKFLAAAITAAALSAMPALSADLPLKAPPPDTGLVLDIHGFFDVQFKNDYITPRGLLVTNTGLTTQVLSGLVLDLYKNPNGFINKVSFVGGTWNDPVERAAQSDGRRLERVRLVPRGRCGVRKGLDVQRAVRAVPQPAR